MPFAEFQNGNAGLALGQYQLQAQDTASSLMERAQRMKMSEFDLERNKQLLAGELALQNSNVQQQNIRVQQMQNEVKQQQNALDLADHTLKTQAIVADNETAHQQAIADARVANSQLMAQLPADLDSLKNIKPEDRTGYLAAWSGLQAKYGNLAADPYYGQQYHTVMAPALAEAAVRNTNFGLMVQNSSAQLTAKLTRAKSTAEMSAVDQDPYFPYVLKQDPEFAKRYDERMKQLSDTEKEMQVKRMEAEVARAKQDREIGVQQTDKVANNPSAIAYRKASAAYDSVVASIDTKEPTRYSDMNALAGYFKIIDPSMGFNASQEEIFKSLQNRKDRWATEFKALYTNSGGMLTPQSRQDLKNAAEIAHKSEQDQYNATLKDYQRGLDAAGVSGDYLPKPKSGETQQMPQIGSRAQLKLPSGKTHSGVVREKGGKLYVVDAQNIGYPILQ